MGQYYLEGNTYVIKDYDKLPPFSSFLPGLAGIKGIPLWVYYTNRGQGINSFGIHNKNNAIMEFNPANTAYENTPIKGFRTFVQCNGEFFEPFFSFSKEVVRNLYIKKNSFTIEELNSRYGIKTTVTYYVIPNDSIGGLVRNVRIENTGTEGKELHLLDGMPKIIPYGIKNNEYKEMSNLLKSWSEIKNTENNIPYYTLRASSDDSAEVSDVEGGYYYLTVREGKVLPVIYDAQVIFDYDTSLVNPIGFLENGLHSVLGKNQCYANKVPCGFTAAEFTLEPGKRYEFNTVVGYAGSIEQINEKREEFCLDGYFTQKEKQAEEAVELLTGDVKTHTANPLFDQYVEQCYLDNFLRGGYPYVFNKEDNKAVVHLFSRKHGDPERDYNFFSIAGEYYSQGNGNFRDVSQNRRNDVFFNKDVGDYNIKTFFQLIQIDGYNPLEVRPATFCVKDEFKKEVHDYIEKNTTHNTDKLYKILEKSFTPGEIANSIARSHITVKGDEDSFLANILRFCNQNTEAGFNEGYWSDHWDYNLDLIENYLTIFPDKITELLFEDNSYRFFDSIARVLPRSEKYVIHKKEVRQYGAVEEDEVKNGRKDFNKKGTNWLKIKPEDGKDFDYASAPIVKTTLMVKLISLALNKFATLDPYGMGIEMEAGKPGWNDAMNGLPGLFGSGMPETFELKRLIAFICDTVILKPNLSMPVEISVFLVEVCKTLNRCKVEKWDDFDYWDAVSALRERYRENTRFYLSGKQQEMNTGELLAVFKDFAEKVEAGIRKAEQYGSGIVPTYFTYRVSQFTPVLTREGQPDISHYGLQKAEVKAFELVPLPAFLEGPARMLGTLDREAADLLCTNIKNSDLYDKKLQMYKTSVPIEHISMENGRIRAFTPGWLERESIFLHMEYKYLLAMLKAGLYERYYEEIKHTMIAFLSPEVYGRSILENSSFLASGENPDSQVQGRGYVARLSGSTTELLTMWIHMFIGSKLFTCEDGELQLTFDPKLPGWFFDEMGVVSFKLLAHCTVTYYNKERKSTYGAEGAKIVNIEVNGGKEIISGNVLKGEITKRIRNGEIESVRVTMI
ncbi:cellobiose phosphorylase [Anaerocolumna sp. MB42-C2]|uniref:cellobiose phosphorylase n=1 Tax=Anaerocolumna sp. MB42-C2 TaxID=3070997 RepID=UPI0027E068AD|nr:cellobiose phosphorylase [Anaerocolumna sp. MB42-C2]WMJ86381.1 cellobiose phosphorylase [Anaerocolumna sp. MB42-C2]